MAKIKYIFSNQKYLKKREVEFFKKIYKQAFSLKEVDGRFQKSILIEKRLIFNYYNFIQENNDYIDKFEILNQYFESKSLFHIKRKDENLPLNIKNMDIVSNQHSTIAQEKKVSIVLTAYNIEDLVEIAIDSLMQQTYKNIEIILVDDGSTDGTFEILQKFKSIYLENVVLIKLHQNYGAYVAKNIGVTYATGDLITFHDGDDWAHPQRIEEHVKTHIKNKKVKFSISKLVRLTKDGYFYAKEVYPLDRLSMVSLMIDKSLLGEIGHFRVHRLGSDSEYFERLKSFTKYKWERIDKVLMFCAHRVNSLTTSSDTGVAGFTNTNKRQHYWTQWHKWHDMLKKGRRKPFIGFNRGKYKYEVIS